MLLDIYLAGLIYCAQQNFVQHPYGDFPQLEYFDSYIKKKLNAETSSLNGAYLLYYHYQENEEKAFGLYFELLDEFIKYNKKNIKL